MPTRTAMIKAALALPYVSHMAAWGNHDAFKVHPGRYFAYMGKADNKPDAVGLKVKLPVSGEAALKAKQVERATMRGWYSVPQAKIEDLPLATVKAWLKESHAAVSAKNRPERDTPIPPLVAAKGAKKAMGFAASSKVVASKATKRVAATKTTRRSPAAGKTKTKK